MRLGLLLLYMRREARGSRGRLMFFTLCLAVGVAAVVAVAGLSAGLDAGIRAQARQLLAADIVISSRQPIPAELDVVLSATHDSQRTNIRETLTVVAAPAVQSTIPRAPVTVLAQPGERAGQAGDEEVPRPGRSLLVELKAVEGDFPFYGELKLDPDRPLRALLQPDVAVVAPELLKRLGAHTGGSILIGGVPFRIAGVVLEEPDRLNVTFDMGPRVFVSGEGLERARIARFGSRVVHRVLIRVGANGPKIDVLAEQIKKALPHPDSFDVQTYAEARPELRDAIRQGFRFLGLGALLSLLIGGIGVAQTVKAWLAGRMDAIAILKSLGMRPREVLVIYLGQTALLGLAGSAAGAVLGSLLQMILPWLLGNFLQGGDISPFQPLAILRGLALGIGVALLFSLPPLLGILRVPPARVLRQGAEPLPPNRWARLATGLVLAAGILATAGVQSGSALYGCLFTAGIAATFGVLALASTLVVRLLAHLPRRFFRVSVRHGLSALARPGAGTLGAIVSLGLGVLVVVSMYLVQSQLSARLAADLPTNSPTAFLVDIQPAQWPGVKALLVGARATRIDSVPVVTARLGAVDGRRVEELAKDRPEDRGRRWALTREQRLTYMTHLPPNNTVVEGALWSDPGRAEISLERDFARDLGARIGSTLRFDLQGVPLALLVTSLRTVKWETFGINFFLIVEPGVLEDAPQLRVAAARLPEGKDQEVQDLLASRFPNIVLIKIRQVLEKIGSILNRVALGVRILGGFTVLAGIAILAGAISAGSVRRGREVALLKTLGMTRWNVVAAFSNEYALVGFVAGTIGACGGGVLAWAVLTKGMKIPWRFDGLAFAAAIAGTAVLSIMAGLAASLRALRRRPIEVLRGEL